jgi:hypothetical protein
MGVRRWVIALLLACAHASCTHAREADDANDVEALRSDGENEGETPAQPAEAPGMPDTLPGDRGLVAGGSRDPESIPVSTSDQGLLKPGAEKAVIDKLGVKSKDGLRAALQKFQRSHDLPATGMLDHETVKVLGLNPEDIFERAGRR